ncbi:hypothetical protein BCR42DRAFT_383287 [Absidia repens]|uniref:Zn(2)-C6 fungal-type domain-containing protein n=1 Tax=Absidia repens TaxID=90262 RepID=A0A1X2I290_9FUNG|nr:hypothetical protein BCR42DRAFT_383287 [Absidia repens]
MEVDQSSQQIRPFIHIQYPPPTTSSFSQFNSSQQRTTRPQQTHITHVQRPDSPPPPKRKRQQEGYACDKCRERRVRCDRVKPTCGKCEGKYDCAYSTHALKLDNVSMRQRMDNMQSTIQRMYDVLMRLETDYRDTVPRMLEQHGEQHNPPPPPPEQSTGSNELLATAIDMNDGELSTAPLLPPQQLTHYQPDPTIVDWAIGTGWHVSANNGLTSIHTDITSYEHLRDAVRRALHMTHQYQVPPLYTSPTHPQNQIFVDDLPSFAAFEKLGRISSPLPRLTSTSSSSPPGSSPASSTTSSSIASSESSSSSSSSSSIQTPGENTNNNNNNTDQLLETDVMTRLIHQHHQCGFPILVSPARFERHYKHGQLKSVVLSSIFCHIAPHACIYHPHLVHLQDFRTLGERFYDHSRMELGLDEQPNLSNIHQRTLLIAYDLDLGRVKRAFVHLGVAIRMCFALDLHRPAGYVQCTTAFEREQAKRVFWTVWFFDTMVPHFFAQSSTMRKEDIKIEVPCVLADFDPMETDQTRFAISIIHVRRLSGTEASLKDFYRSLPNTHRCASPIMAAHGSIHGGSGGGGGGSSLWSRRTYFCVLLDYCLFWIDLSRPRIPRKSAIRRTSQAAFAMLALFSHWFRFDDHFDCFFRPYLYHYMRIIQIFKNNITQQDGPRSPILVAQSQAALIKLFHMYCATPTHRSFAESQLEKDLLVFIQQHHILTLAQLQYGHHQDPDPMCINELIDDPEHSDYYGWGIFSVTQARNYNNSNNNQSSSTSGSGGGSTRGGSSTLSTSSSSMDMDNDNLYLS